MITLKHVAREYDLDPYALRQKLRSQLEHKPNQRWQWDEKDPNLSKAREIAKGMKSNVA